MHPVVVLTKKQHRASRAPVTAHLPLTSLWRQTTQLGQLRSLCDPHRQLLTPEHANRPVAPPWLALRWKSTDTSICLVKGSEGAGGWGRREESWGENRQIGVTVSCEKSFRVWCMCGANYATSACVKIFFFLIWNIFIWWHFFPTCLRDFKGFGDCITLAVSHYSSVTHVQHTGSERQPAHELKNAYRWMKWLWKGHIARFCVRLE